MSSPLIDVQQISKQFPFKNGRLNAVENVSFSLERGEILGIGGESGCGKSTIAKMLIGLEEPTSGSILFEGRSLKEWSKDDSREWRRRIQMIFQHPGASLNPRNTIEETLREPFLLHSITPKSEIPERISELLSQVGLSDDFLKRLPQELSGGQKQRIAIARALALEPDLLICDEPFSALDVSIQAQIINLLVRLQKERIFSLVVISHDLSILRYLTDRLLIMYLGQMMELGPSQTVYAEPLHPYSQALASAILLPDPSQERKPFPLSIQGDLTSPFASALGCPYFNRCPFARKICQEVKPKWKEAKPGHFVACHLY